ncbi:MAG: RHS repeat protein [Acidobacteria bacterium]|nr:RHS repeat protein [Acidobacteriota bacterium]
MQLETRTFDGVPGTYALAYEYNLANQVKKITDSANETVEYTYDKAGQQTDVTGSVINGVWLYATNMKYRAWGGLISLIHGNGLTLTAQYTSRLQLSSLVIANRQPQFGAPIASQSTYQRYPDGRLKHAQTQGTVFQNQAFNYNQVGRTVEAYSGSEADDFINNTTTAPATGPFRESYKYDVWSNLKARTSRF